MYPESIDCFIEKLNKLDNHTYVIEEEVILREGVYEGYLEHDNVSVKSVNVYSGKKLTGEKINTFVLSTPSETPWRNIIKIFSDYPMVYITYETQGDTVEAEDINKLQDSIVNTQKEVDRYKNANDLGLAEVKNRVTIVENKKADKTYVDGELNKRYTKSEVYTKSEADSRIQEVVGAAPEALDTLQEIANSLNNDANFAGTMVNELSKKVDKVSGKGLSTNDYTNTEKNKLAGIETGANKYIHPSTHNATMIVEDSTHRFITDIERVNWNDSNSKKHTHSNKSIIDTITQVLVDKWNSAVEHITDAVKHITSAERTLWNTVSNKAEKTHTHDDRYYTEAEANSKFVTKNELGDAGYGDMAKSIYDTNGDGVVDKAEKVEWSGVLNKPSSFPPSSHSHDYLPIEGGTVTGDVVLKRGMTIHTAKNGGGVVGYMHILRLKVKQPYVNQPIVLVVLQKGNNQYSELEICFKNSNSTDPNIETFTKTGDISAYIRKSAVSTWDLYIYKTEAYDCIDIVDLKIGDKLRGSNAMDILFQNETVTTLPSGGTYATLKCKVMNIAGDADTLDGKHATDFMKVGPIKWDDLRGV